MQKYLPLAVIAALIAISGSFFGGMKFSELRQPAQRQLAEFAGQRGSGNVVGNMAGRNGVGQAANLLSGELLSQDATSITVKLRDGGSKTAYYSTSTEVGKYVSGSLSDLSIGSNIMVSGKAGANGSLIADMIQIRPDDGLGIGRQMPR